MSNYNTTIEKIQEKDLPLGTEWKYGKVIDQINVIDVVRMSTTPRCHIKKLTKYEYVKGYYDAQLGFVAESGEVLTVPRKEDGNQMRNRRSLRKIFKDLRYLINSNFEGGEKEIFVTLTYADQTNDHKQIHRDFGKFWKRLTYTYNEHKLEYIAIVEPHASGMFHIHLLLKSDKPLYIPDAEIRKIWGLGLTMTERLDDVSNFGAYFVAYFSNLELTDDEIMKYASEDDVIERDGKKFIKGKRLDFYPDYMKIYRQSKGILKPNIIAGQDMAYHLPEGIKQYHQITRIKDEESDTEIYISSAQYRKDKDRDKEKD